LPVYTQCNTDSELNALFIFCDIQEITEAFEAIKKMRFFAKIVPTPKDVFPAKSLSIAVKKEDLGILSDKLQELKIVPIKSVTFEKCVFSYP